MDRATIKANAKAQIKGKIGILFVIYLIMAAIATVVSMIPGVGSLAYAVVLGPAFSLAVIKIYLGLTCCVEPNIKALFGEFNNFWSAFKVTFLVGLFTYLWSLLLIIPGIIKGISYSQAMYILAENPEIGAREAINRSKAMMDGHKMEYFVLMLSFIGWYLLCAITFGIATIWVIPYISAAYANFYNSIKSPVEA